jgi:ABC-type multidrug transport system fused ATPase/permease subunit
MGINNVIEFYKITVFIFFVTILEVVGIGLIIPFLSFISNSEKFISNVSKYLTNFDFYDALFFFQTLSNSEVTFIILGLIFAIFAIKFLYLLFVAWRVSKFLLSLQKDLSDRLLKKYLSLTYIFHLNHNASVLASSVVKESSVFSNTVINSFMVLLADGFLILAFIILVILFDPFLSSILILFSSTIVFSYYFFIKKMVTGWGEKRQFHDGLKLKHLFQEEYNKVLGSYCVDKNLMSNVSLNNEDIYIYI